MSSFTTFIGTNWKQATEAVNGTIISPITVLSIAALESGNGGSVLSARYGNYFGIKGISQYGSVEMPTKEYINGRMVTIPQNFRTYPNFAASAKDFVNLITSSSRYKNVLDYRDPVLQLTQIMRSGYATDPDYIGKVSSAARQIEAMRGLITKSGPLTFIEIGLSALMAYGFIKTITSKPEKNG
jgi:flagellum-specific peptidoglycan hydrolase FlgJ